LGRKKTVPYDSNNDRQISETPEEVIAGGRIGL